MKFAFTIICFFFTMFVFIALFPIAYIWWIVVIGWIFADAIASAFMGYFEDRQKRS